LLVAGAPATGKTTLADRLAARLSVPVLHRDPISNAIADALGPDDPALRRVLIPASFGVFYALMDDFLTRGDLVAETNFHHGASESDLGLRCLRTRAVLIHCTTSHECSVARFRARFERGERHWSSFDAERLAQIDEGQIPPAWANAVPLDLPVPILAVDTTDGYAPNLDAILTFVRSSASG
jgi:predicted kinase